MDKTALRKQMLQLRSQLKPKFLFFTLVKSDLFVQVLNLLIPLLLVIQLL